MLAVLLVVVLVYSASLVALVRDATHRRRALRRLEQRIAALELHGPAKLVVEPGPEADLATRPRNALVN